jgi:hypothetical protein
MEETTLESKTSNSMESVKISGTSSIKSKIVRDGILLNWNDKYVYHFQTNEAIDNEIIENGDIVFSNNFILLIDKSGQSNSILLTVGLAGEEGGEEIEIGTLGTEDLNINPKIIRGFGLARYSSKEIGQIEVILNDNYNYRTEAGCNGVAGGIGSTSCSLNIGADITVVGAEVDCTITCDPGYYSCCDPLRTPSCYCIKDGSSGGKGGGSGSGGSGGSDSSEHCTVINAYVSNGVVIVVVLCHEH